MSNEVSNSVGSGFQFSGASPPQPGLDGSANAPTEVGLTSVNAQFVEKDITPFVGGGSKIFAAVDRSNLKKESSKSLLDGPDTSDLGPEKGRLDRLHAQYKGDPSNDPSNENLNMLLVEVERYARRVTLGKSGKLKQWLNQSQTYQYPMTETSTTTAMLVWKNLDKFNGQSKFSSWVYRIAHNTRKDIVEGVFKRGEVGLLEWKDYQSSYHGCHGAASESENGEYETRGGTKTTLTPPPPSIPSLPVSSLQPKDRGVDEATRLRLGELAGALSGQDAKILDLFLEGYTPIEIAKKMGGRNAKWASNQLEGIKKTLRLANGGKPAVLDVKKEENATNGDASQRSQTGAA